MHKLCSLWTFVLKTHKAVSHRGDSMAAGGIGQMAMLLMWPAQVRRAPDGGPSFAPAVPPFRSGAVALTRATMSVA